LLWWGPPRSGRSSLLAQLVLDLAEAHPPTQAQIALLDLAGGALAPLAGLPHVLAYAGRHQGPLVDRVVREAAALVEERLAAYPALGVTDYPSYRAARDAGGPAGDRYGEVLLVVDGAGAFRAEHPDIEPQHVSLATSGLAAGVHLVLSAGRWLDVRPQVLDAIGTRLELHLNDPADSALGKRVAENVADGRPGHGLTRDGELFQIADPRDRAGLADRVRRAAAGWPGNRAPVIALLPERLRAADVAVLTAGSGRTTATGPASTAPSAAAPAGWLLGVEEFATAPVRLADPADSGSLLVLGDGGSGRTSLLSRVIAATAGRDDIDVHLVDPSRGLLAAARTVGARSFAATAAQATQLAAGLAGLLATRPPRAVPAPRPAARPARQRGTGPRVTRLPAAASALHTRTQPVVLVTVRGPRQAVDLAITADVPVVGLLTTLVPLVAGEPYDPVHPACVRWHLVDEQHNLLVPRVTLADAGVVDGAVLHLRDRPAIG